METSKIKSRFFIQNLFAGDPSDDDDDSADADSSFFKNSKNGVTDLTTQVAMSSVGNSSKNQVQL